MKACRTGEADDAVAAVDADDEPVFRPLRRNNWVAFRKRERRAASEQSSRNAQGPLNLPSGLPPSDDGYENEAFGGEAQRPQRDVDEAPPSYASTLLMTSDGVGQPCASCPVAAPYGDRANEVGSRSAGPDPPESPDVREVSCRDVGVSAPSVAGRPGPGIGAATLARHRNDAVAAGATRLEPGPPPHHEVLPDILNAHLPPPYATLPPPSSSARRHLPPPPRLRPPRCVVDTEVVEPKHCCGVLVTQTVSIRWFIVMIAFVGLCCAIVGTVLGALKATGREHLTVSLLMIGE
ncbi:hypothetical protein V5799_003581 [Amblyomma americanum]|uniref:Uncharacterized protein n=1 Tax=Amblyomma americanum TaxID=6943 RepID=A0AAQ4D8J7_AMBAM